MSNLPKLTRYVSEIDQFLQTFDHEHPELAKSQQKEQTKYRRVYLLRDDPLALDSSQIGWDKF
jgi:hypothetical protein